MQLFRLIVIASCYSQVVFGGGLCQPEKLAFFRGDCLRFVDELVKAPRYRDGWWRFNWACHPLLILGNDQGVHVLRSPLKACIKLANHGVLWFVKDFNGMTVVRSKRDIDGTLKG